MAGCLPLWQRIVPAGPFGSYAATFSPLKRWDHGCRENGRIGCEEAVIIVPSAVATI